MIKNINQYKIIFTIIKYINQIIRNKIYKNLMKFLINNNNNNNSGLEVCNILAQLLNPQILIHKSNINQHDFR